MATGDLKDAASNISLTTVVSGNVTMAGVTANVGDLVYALFVEETNLTVSGVTDNLGNTYTALNAGTDAGAVTARAFYSKVTISGALTTVTFAATSSADNCIGLAVLIQGPITALDKNIANSTSDITSPFSAPATGSLTQASEIVVSWGATNLTAGLAASSPMTLLVTDTVAGLRGSIASKLVSSTTTTTPVFTGTNPTQAIFGTSTFKAALTDTITVTNAAITFAGKTVTVRDTDLIPLGKATAVITGKTVTVPGDFGIITVNAATVALTGKTVTDVDTTPGDSVVVIEGAALVLRGQSIITIGTIPVDQASMTFAGRSVTIETTTFQDIPKYIIRGRGSRHALWTQGNGGTIKGRGSRAFLVMQ
jgi:hypothetical protein